MAQPGTQSLAAPPALDAGLLAIAIVGVSFSGPLMAATVAPALGIAFWRNAIGAGVSATLAGLRQRAELRSLERRSVVTAVAAGAALSVHFSLWVPSLTMTTVASATSLVCGQTIFVALIAQIQGHRLPGAAWAGILVATVGTVLITGADLTLSGRALVGDLMAVGGGLAGAVYVSTGALARVRMSAASYTAICYLTCSALLLVTCLVFGVRLGGYSGDAWLKIVLVTLCAQLLGHSLLNVVLRSTSPTLISLTILLEVPGAGLIAYFWLHQRPPLSALPGIALLLGGLALTVRARPRETAIADVD